MKIKIYVLSTVLADENGPAMPALFADESEARAKYDEVMRWEWDSMMDHDIDGPYPGMHSMINIFSFPNGEPNLVYMETDYAIEEVSSAESVNTYVQAFGRASDGALEPADTAVFLRQLADQLE